MKEHLASNRAIEMSIRMPSPGVTWVELYNSLVTLKRIVRLSPLLRDQQSPVGSFTHLLLQSEGFFLFSSSKKQQKPLLVLVHDVITCALEPSSFSPWEFPLILF